MIKGTIIKRTIRGKERFYHQWREDGKTKSRYLKPEEILPLRAQLEAAKSHQAEPVLTSRKIPGLFLSGTRLRELAAAVQPFSVRELFTEMLNQDGIVFLSGLPQTGKTTLLRQGLSAACASAGDACRYLSLAGDISRSLFLSALQDEYARGARHFFIDGLERAPSLSAIIPSLEDTLVPLGCRFTIAATEPHNCLISSQTHDLSSNFVPYRDHVALRQKDSLLDYLQNGGLNPAFIDTATQNTLAQINRLAVHQILSEPPRSLTHRTVRLGHDLSRIARHLMEDLPQAQSNETLQPLIQRTLVARAEDETIILHPKLRRELTDRLIRTILDDSICAHLGAAERKIVLDTVHDESTHHVLADLVLHEIMRTRQSETTDVFRVRFPSGGFDLVVADREELTCELYEVRATDVRDDRQLTNLLNTQKLDTIEHRYGTIVSRELLYLGRNAWHASGIAYRNVRDYL